VVVRVARAAAGGAAAGTGGGCAICAQVEVGRGGKE
jgi:hypothetical protein